MAKYLNIIEKITNKYSCCLFIILTFFYAILRTPFYDEGYAYMLSQLSVKEIFQLIPIEGHPFLWYFLLKIFCSNLSLYPYPMLVMNWLFFSVFIYIFWKKAPFNTLIKFLITFSYVFLNYYAVYSRPYGLAILVLSLLVILYKDSYKRPFLYTFLILVCFNICVLSMFGAGALFVLFLYKLFKEEKNKKKFYLIMAILVGGTILSACQFIHLETLYEIKYANIFNYIQHYFLPSLDSGKINFMFRILRLVLIFYIPYLLFKKSKESLFFLVFTYLFLIYLFLKFYPPMFWHCYFYLIYLIFALWLSWDKIKEDKFLNIILIFFFITLLTPKSIVPDEQLKIMDSTHYKNYINAVLELNKNNNAKFFSPDWYSPVSSGILPYLKKYNIKLYDAHNIQKDTLNSMKNTYKYEHETFNGEEFIKYLDDNTNNYLLTANYFFSHKDNTTVLHFKDLDFYYKDLLYFKTIYIDFDKAYLIYKIEKLKNEKQ